MRHPWIVGALLVLAAEAAAQDTATFSFSQNHSGTCPRTVSGGETIKVDLSGLPERAVVHRAVLRPGRVEGEAVTHRDVAPKVLLEGRDQPLPLLPPRFNAFDVTAEVRAALAAGERSVSFHFQLFPGYQPPENPDERLKVHVLILDRALRADAVKVSVFRQTRRGGGWADAPVDPKTSTALEDKILTKARELRIATAQAAG